MANSGQGVLKPVGVSNMPIIIITDFKDLPSFEVLKKHLISLYRLHAQPIFDIHNPHLRYIFQLRVGLSHLRHHKRCHNFADTPSDKCLCKTGVEDTHHFLIACPFYTTHRKDLFTCIKTLLQKHNLSVIIPVELLLNGHPSLDVFENGVILLATLEFIIKTEQYEK